MSKCEDLLSPFYESFENELESHSLNFPTSFDIIKRALDIFNNEDSSINEYVKLIQSEPVLLAKVLRLANSVAMNPHGQEIVNAHNAIQRLGTKKIKCLTYLVVMEQIKQDNRNEAVKSTANVLWKHSVDISCFAYCLAKETRICNADEAMLAGLMYDIGQFYILSRVCLFPDILKNGDCFKEVLSRNHSYITKNIIDALKLPNVVIELYNRNLKNHPIWPLKDIADIVSLSSMVTHYSNPFLTEIEDSKKNIFFNSLTPKENVVILTIIEQTEMERLELFNSMII